MSYPSTPQTLVSFLFHTNFSNLSNCKPQNKTCFSFKLEKSFPSQIAMNDQTKPIFSCGTWGNWHSVYRRNHVEPPQMFPHFNLPSEKLDTSTLKTMLTMQQLDALLRTSPACVKAFNFACIIFFQNNNIQSSFPCT